MKTTHKKILLAVALGVMVTLAGCGGLGQSNGDDNTDDAQDIADSTDANVAIDNVGASYWFEIGITESNQDGLVRAQPPFEMERSLERENLIRRYQHLNDENNEHHVYMLSHDGKVIAYYVAQGKVSSVNSKLTNDQQIVRAKDCSFDGGNGAGGAEGSCFKTVESPQMDGSYGTNGDGIFFFTASGDYVEYNGIYVVSEEPKDITTEVTLIGDVEDEDTAPTTNNSQSNSTQTQTAP